MNAQLDARRIEQLRHGSASDMQIARLNLDPIFQREFSGGTLIVQLDQDRQLVRTRHGKLLVCVDQDFGSRFDVLDRDAYLASRPRNDLLDLLAQDGEIRRPCGCRKADQDDR